MNIHSITAERAMLSTVLLPTYARCLHRHGYRYLSTATRKRNAQSSNGTDDSGTSAKLDIAALLATPSWSVSSLLPPKNLPDSPPPITSKQLHHLLKLSALPPPSSPEEEKSMMDTLAAQLHFVKEMQKVDTTGIKPLSAIRDETLAAEKEQEITLESLKDALAQEEVVGKHYKRIRRRPETEMPQRQPRDWDPLSHAKRKSGKFFVVDSGKGDGD